jgi:kynureninase
MNERLVLDAERAARLDAADPLAPLRDAFHIPLAADGRPQAYLAGNSLGLQPRGTRDAVLAELDDWARLGVEGHFEARRPWFDYHECVRGSLARLVGASPAEVVAMGSLSANLHLAMASFYRPSGSRRRVLLEWDVFASDRYAVQGQVRWHDGDPGVELVEVRGDERGHISTEAVVEAIEAQGDALALVLWSGVNYYTGQRYDLDAIAAAARRVGAAVGFDLAHAIGNVPLALHQTAPDFAVWCSYKYLNGGPGTVAGLFVAERHHGDRALVRLAGWWGNDPATRFSMPRGFVPTRSADAWQVSNAPVLPIAALRASLDLFDQAPAEARRAKSLALGQALIDSVEERLGGLVQVLTPRDGARGSQISIRLGAEARRVCGQLRERGVVCDFRAPDVIRAAPVPLYNRFADVLRLVDALDEIARTQPWTP